MCVIHSTFDCKSPSESHSGLSCAVDIDTLPTHIAVWTLPRRINMKLPQVADVRRGICKI